MKTGTGEQKRYVAIHETAEQYGNSVLKALPSVHAITGCDSVSSFSGIGKKTALTTLKENIDEVIEIFQFGDSASLDLQDECVEAAIKFVCLLYDKKAKDADINGLRYTLFSKKNLSVDKLPPTLDALTLHLRRAAYQCYVWKHACQKILDLPSPAGNGWIITDGGLEPK